MGNAVVSVNLGLPSDLSGLARFAAGLGEDYVGDLFLVNGKTGVITSGSQGFEHEPGEQFAIFVGEAQGGFVLWENGKIAAQAWTRIADADSDLDDLRAGLGDTDPANWKRFTPRGEPEDPYKISIRIPMVDPKTGRLFTFSSSAGSAVRAARKLIKNCLIQVKANPATTANHVPLVAISVGSFSTTNGAVFYPAFEVMDWLPVGAVLHSLAKAGNATAFGVSNEAALNEDLGPLTAENTTSRKAR